MIVIAPCARRAPNWGSTAAGGAKVVRDVPAAQPDRPLPQITSAIAARSDRQAPCSVRGIPTAFLRLTVPAPCLAGETISEHSRSRVDRFHAVSKRRIERRPRLRPVRLRHGGLAGVATEVVPRIEFSGPWSESTHYVEGALCEGHWIARAWSGADRNVLRAGEPDPGKSFHCGLGTNATGGVRLSQSNRSRLQRRRVPKSGNGRVRGAITEAVRAQRRASADAHRLPRRCAVEDGRGCWR